MAKQEHTELKWTNSNYKENLMSEEIAQQWLDKLAASANALDLDTHMNLISKKVNLMGVPGFESICYEQ